MAVLRFEIRYRDGTKEVMPVDGTRALVGNGGHCDIRLRVDQAAYEHLSFEYTDGKLTVEALASDPPATIDDEPFKTAEIFDHTAIFVGQLRIGVKCESVDVEQQRIAAEKKKNAPNPLLVVGMGILMVAAVAFMILNRKEPIPDAPVALPDVFTAMPSGCPKAGRDQAYAFAQEKFIVAAGKRDRHPFVPKDGPMAVNLYEQAAACFRAADERADEKRAMELASSLRQRITDDMRARSVRLEHALRVGDTECARIDALVLTSLTDGKTGPYVTWLDEVRRVGAAKKAPL